MSLLSQIIEDNEEAREANETDELTVPSEDFIATTYDDYEAFNTKAWNAGNGYETGTFPIFDEKMEGLEQGLFLFAGESNHGKAMPLNTPVLKANGKWTTIGDIKLGDKVWGDDGKPTTVVCKSKLFHDHKCYKITFDDGESLIADAEHLWKVYRYYCHKPTNREMVLKTEDMLKDFKHVDPKSGYATYRYRVPMQKPLEYKEKKLPVPPYVLGLWLGDGSRNGNRFSCNSDEFPVIKAQIEKNGYEVGPLHKEQNTNDGWTYKIGTKTINGYQDAHNDFLDGLRQLNVIGNKHIPRDYLNASIEQRWELLRGLMDTDGSCQKDIGHGHGRCEFVQKESSKIVNDFGELLASLGIKFTVEHKNASCNGEFFPAVRFSFATDKEHSCFCLPHKKEHLRDKLAPRTFMYKTIKDIQAVDTVTTQCIEVDNQSHCFCVGKNLTVTHNTAALTNIMWAYCMNPNNKLFGIYFSLDDTKDKVISRLIAANQKIPISVVSKPQRYQNAIDNRIDNYEAYPELLEKREAGFEELRQTADRFKVVDGTQITCGEQLIDYCQKLQAYIRAAKGDDWNIIVGIDSVSDVEWHGQTFKSENEENNFNAKQLKRLAVEMLHCPVFGSIHLRKVDQNKRPTIADVKESGRYVYEADLVFLVYNDVCRNKESAAIYFNDPGSTAKGAVVELDWAKNKVSSFKGRTYQNFFTNYSKMVECTAEETERFNRLIYSR